MPAWGHCIHRKLDDPLAFATACKMGGPCEEPARYVASFLFKPLRGRAGVRVVACCTRHAEKWARKHGVRMPAVVVPAKGFH